MIDRRSVLVGAGAFAFARPANAQLIDERGRPVQTTTVGADVIPTLATLPGVYRAGAASGRVTIAEFYDYNCGVCRSASRALFDLIGRERDVSLLLVPVAILSLGSVQAHRVEVALRGLVPPARMVDFHRRMFARRGAIDGQDALETARALGANVSRVENAADQPRTVEVLRAHLTAFERLGFPGTPGFVVGRQAFFGWPGARAMTSLVATARTAA